MKTIEEITDERVARMSEDASAARQIERHERITKALALREAADALELQPPMLKAQYVATLRLYANEPWRLEGGADEPESVRHSESMLERNHSAVEEEIKRGWRW